jgi:hypothetical protein
MIPAVVTIVALIVLLAALIIIPRLLLKRAIRKVVARMRKQGATSIDTAKTLDGLGLRNKGPFGTMFQVRDYRPYAIRLLGQAQILQRTEDGRIFLSEETLAESPVNKYAGVG